MRQVAVAALVVLALGVTPSVARADDDAEITEMAKEHYKAGLDAYKAGHFQEAIKELKKAYLLKRLPALLLNIGATYRKMGDPDNAVYYYKKYLAEAPDARDRPEVERTLAEVEHEKRGGGGASEAPPAEAPPAPSVASWSHTPVDAAPPGAPIDVRVSMPVMKGVKVYVYYRGAGEADFTSVLMKRHGGEKVGRIPADAIAGKSLQYYIEGKDDRGSVVKSFGSPSSPNIVTIDENAKPQVVGDERAVAATDDDSGGSRRDLDDEEAPIMGSVAEPHSGGHAKRASGSRDRQAGYGPVFWTGVAVAAAGAIGVGVGLYGLYQAHSYSNVLTADSRGDPTNHNAPFQFNDPNATPYDDKTVEHRGQLWNEFGLGFTIPGGVLLATGVVLMIVDQTALHHAPAEKPKRHSSSAWFVSPTGGANNVGLAAGGAF